MGRWLRDQVKGKKRYQNKVLRRNFFHAVRRRSEKSEGDWEGLRELSSVQGTFFRPQAPACPYRQQVSKQGELRGGHSGGALHPLKIISLLLLLLVCLGLRPTEWGRFTSGWGRGGRPSKGRGKTELISCGGRVMVWGCPTHFHCRRRLENVILGAICIDGILKF